MGDQYHRDNAEPAEHIPLLNISSPNSNQTSNDTNNNDSVIITILPDESENEKNISGVNSDHGYKRDSNIRAPPDIYIMRPSTPSESTANRLETLTDQTSGDRIRPARKHSNRFLVNATHLDGDQLQSPKSAILSGKVGDDDVFTSSPPSSSILQVPKVNIFEHELPKYPNISTDSQGTNSQSVARISIRSVGQNEAGKIAEQGRRFANRQTERLVSKDGTCNILSKNVPRGHNSWSRDIFTTLLDLRWRYIILVFAAVLVGSWFFFAILWWAISVLHGDHLAFNNVIEENKLPDNTLDVDGLFISNDTSGMSQNRSKPFNYTSNGMFEIKELMDSGLPCVYGVHNFITALLFSIETQQTIGYGTRYITSNCIYGIVLLVAQSCTGMVLLALTTGIIHSKVCKPKSRAHTMMFSRFAVICLRDDEYCLLFRVGDMRRSYLIGTSIRAIVMKAKQGDEKLNPLSQHTLELENDLKDTSPLLIWPVTMVHRINESSPLWHMSPEDLILAKFEIIVVLEGTIEHTGMTAQFRTSYLPSEILWGNHLAPLLTYQKQNGKYEIDFTLFHNVTPTNMPECSAKVYAGVKNSENRVVGSNPTGFATGGFKRVLSRNARKKMKPKDARDDQLNSPEINGSKSLQWRLPGNPNLSLNRLSVNAARNFFKSRKERPRSARS